MDSFTLNTEQGRDGGLYAKSLTINGTVYMLISPDELERLQKAESQLEDIKNRIAGVIRAVNRDRARDEPDAYPCRHLILCTEERIARHVLGEGE